MLNIFSGARCQGQSWGRVLKQLEDEVILGPRRGERRKNGWKGKSFKSQYPAVDVLQLRQESPSSCSWHHQGDLPGRWGASATVYSSLAMWKKTWSKQKNETQVVFSTSNTHLVRNVKYANKGWCIDTSKTWQRKHIRTCRKRSTFLPLKPNRLHNPKPKNYSVIILLHRLKTM